jgi:release factor glutamine methyltransferase
MVATNELLIEAKKKLKEHDVDEREARLLLSFVLGCRKEEIPKYNEVQDDVASKFEQAVERRCERVPYAYIVGHKEFMKLDFKVNENVLIPREDTEVLVERVISIAQNLCKDNRKEVRILDMCTGSGCIAISLKKNLNNSIIVAIDKSKEALEIAKENAKNNGANVEFIESDLFEKLDIELFKNEEDRFDIIVSNPPYVEEEMIPKLAVDVNAYEPEMALNGGKDGLDFYRKISKEAEKYLKQKGVVAFEIGYYQANAVSKILEENGYENIEVAKDYSGNDRVVVATK